MFGPHTPNSPFSLIPSHFLLAYWSHLVSYINSTFHDFAYVCRPARGCPLRMTLPAAASPTSPAFTTCKQASSYLRWQRHQVLYARDGNKPVRRVFIPCGAVIPGGRAGQTNGQPLLVFQRSFLHPKGTPRRPRRWISFPFLRLRPLPAGPRAADPQAQTNSATPLFRCSGPEHFMTGHSGGDHCSGSFKKRHECRPAQTPSHTSFKHKPPPPRTRVHPVPGRPEHHPSVPESSNPAPG